MRRPTPTSIGSGFTLLELMVSMAIFAVLATVVALSLKSYAASQVQSNIGSDVDRALSLTAGRLETRLRGCRVVTPLVGDTTQVLTFQPPQVGPEGLLVVGPSGAPEWEPAREVTLENGVLVVGGSAPTVVGNLGPLGEINYERLEAGILRVSLTASFEGADSVSRKSDSLTVDLATVP